MSYVVFLKGTIFQVSPFSLFQKCQINFPGASCDIKDHLHVQYMVKNFQDISKILQRPKTDIGFKADTKSC